jgi:hypothetical protein
MAPSFAPVEENIPFKEYFHCDFSPRLNTHLPTPIPYHLTPAIFPAYINPKMKFVTSLAILATAAAVSASPVQKIFNLVTSGASDDSNNGLYLSTEHEDPLNSKAVFREKTDAADFYFTNGTVRYDAPNGAPYAIALIPGEDQQGDVEISVSPTTGSRGFRLTSEKQLKTSNKDFGGWLGKLILSFSLIGSKPGQRITY